MDIHIRTETIETWTVGMSAHQVDGPLVVLRLAQAHFVVTVPPAIANIGVVPVRDTAV